MPSQRQHEWTKEQLLEAVVKVRRKLGHSPTTAEFDHWAGRMKNAGRPFPTRRQIIERFGTWNGTLRLLGMTPTPAGRVKDAKLVERLLS